MMRQHGRWILFCLCLWVCAAAGAYAQSESSDQVVAGSWEEHAFVEMSAPSLSCYVHETVALSIRFGYDTQFFNDHAIQLFQSHLDVPVQLRIPWWDGLEGTLLASGRFDLDDAEGAGLLFALNDGLFRAKRIADRTFDSRAFTVLEITRFLQPTKAGELVLNEPVLRYAHASRFTDSLISGRVAADRTDVAVPGESLILQVAAPPEKGRPRSFIDAVGSFSISAGLNRADCIVGESMRLEIVIRGQGNISTLTPPTPALEGFHLYGMIEGAPGPGRRTFLYDLAPDQDTLMEVPSIEFACFDPGPPPEYRSMRTRAIPITVHPVPEGRRTEKEKTDVDLKLVPGENDIYNIIAAEKLMEHAPGKPLTWTRLLLVMLSPWPLALGLFLWLRRRERILSDPEGQRARAAANVFAEVTGQSHCDLMQAFVEYLAARLLCSPGAVVSPDLCTRLEAASVPAEIAQETVELLNRLVAARYGGTTTGSMEHQAAAMVDRLESIFLSLEDTP